MAEAESEEAARLQNKAFEMLKSPSSIVLPASKEPKSSYFLTNSLAEMANEDPIRLQNQSCVIRKEIVKIVDDEIVVDEQLVYSSLARLSTFSVGLSSTQGEDPPRAPLRESSVDPEDKSQHRYFQMPELGARVFVGDRDGFDTIACHLFDGPYDASKFHFDAENAAVKSIYKDDHPGGLSGWLQTQSEESWRSKHNLEVILSGTELFVDHFGGAPMVGNLGGKSWRVSGSSFYYRDCTGDETIKQPSDIVQGTGTPVPSEHSYWVGYWGSVEEPDLWRFTQGSYLKKPKFMKWNYQNFPLDLSNQGVLQLTRFDDFVILGNALFDYFLHPHKVIDIVRKNASETADVIAAQLVKGVIEERWPSHPWPLHPGSITAIVIFLDHKEILLKKHKKEKKENMAKKYITTLLELLGLKGISQSTVLKDVKKIAKTSKEEEKILVKKLAEISKEEEKIFASQMENKKQIMMEEDHKMKLLVGGHLPNDPQISMVSLEQNELGMKSSTISSNLTSIEVQDDSEASSSIVLVEDDCKSEDVKVSHHITKWIIYGDIQERTLLCFFCIEEMQYEFYFEDHEIMATIIGLGVPHSKVILECGSPHVTVVEIPKEDWDVVWVHSNVIPRSIPKSNVLKQESFPDILHRIANIINSDNIVSKANNGGVGGDNGKDNSQGNADDNKGKGKSSHDHDDHRNTGHPNGSSNGAPNDNENKENDNKERKRKDGNDEKKEGRDQNDGKTSNDCKEVQAIVHLRLLPGGVIEDKGKKKELGEGHEEEVEEKKIELGEIYEEEVEEKKEKLGDFLEEVEEVKKKELGKGRKVVEKKEKKKHFKALWNALTGGVNGNVVGKQQMWPTTEGVENGDIDENLEKELVKQIHAQMVFTFTIKDEADGPLKTIQATIDPITFQFPSSNEENYLQRRRFGWFHKKLQVAFGIVNTEVADLDAKSCKVLDSFEAKEINLQGNSKGNARTSTNAYKVKMGIKHGVTASGEYYRTNGLEAKTNEEVHNSWETNKTLTKGGYSISEHTDLNTHQLKYSYCPHFPFNEKEFEVRDEDDRLKMYDNPICQLQRVSCEGTWHPYDSENLEAYKLEASRELGMTKIYNLDLEIGEEKQQKKVWKVEKNLPLCFIQKLEKLVYLNHAMSHLTSSTTGVYRLKEQQGLSDPSTTFVTQARNKREPEWPSNDPLVDVKQKRII